MLLLRSRWRARASVANGRIMASPGGTVRAVRVTAPDTDRSSGTDGISPHTGSPLGASDGGDSDGGCHPIEVVGILRRGQQETVDSGSHDSGDGLRSGLGTHRHLERGTVAS